MQKTAIYRIVQEALLNVSKHAKASHVLVGLQFNGQQMHLIVEDDGVGLPAKLSSIGQGIDNMRERLRAIGGTLKIEPLQSGGTRLQGWLPLNQNQET